jgi:hypothetical protein
VYQSIARGVYLFEVRKKALDVRNENAERIDEIKAIVKIQAVSKKLKSIHFIKDHTRLLSTKKGKRNACS